MKRERAEIRGWMAASWGGVHDPCLQAFWRDRDTERRRGRERERKVERDRWREKGGEREVERKRGREREVERERDRERERPCSLPSL